jgi:tRNA A-37 threonylcarbamoyl transferase component Bud32
VGAGVYRDTLLGRFVRVLPAEPAHLARAAAFARADHPALASVLAFRPEDHTLWVEHVEGEPLQGPLGAVELRRLEEALAALHRAGATHGFVRADHVRVQNGETVLAFPVYDAHASEEDDFRDLHALAARK